MVSAAPESDVPRSPAERNRKETSQTWSQVYPRCNDDDDDVMDRCKLRNLGGSEKADGLQVLHGVSALRVDPLKQVDLLLQDLRLGVDHTHDAGLSHTHTHYTSYLCCVALYLQAFDYFLKHYTTFIALFYLLF